MSEKNHSFLSAFIAASVVPGQMSARNLDTYSPVGLCVCVRARARVRVRVCACVRV